MEAAKATLLVVERCAATLPSAFYTPASPLPPAPDSHAWTSVCEQNGVKARGTSVSMCPNPPE